MARSRRPPFERIVDLAYALDWKLLGRWGDFSKGIEIVKKRVAFLAFTEAHQHLHWLPVALRLAEKPDVEVTVLSGSKAALRFIQNLDRDRVLKLRYLWFPKWGDDDLFRPPRRTRVLLFHGRTIASYPFLVTTEVTSSVLYRQPGFASKMIHMKHGAGDQESSFNSRHALFDLTLVYGQKHKDRLVERGWAFDDDCHVVGCAKFELAGEPIKLFPNDNPVALYNPHWKNLSTFPRFGERLIRKMEELPNWNFIVAPHVKSRFQTVTTAAPNIIVDVRSARSIDMTYTQAADIYIGDVSSQVYEFVRRSRPCIFLNLEHVDWRGRPNYLHWTMGQVIEHVDDLGPALDRADYVQPLYADLQRELFSYSIDESDDHPSARQAEIILKFMEGEIAPRRSELKPGVKDGSHFQWLFRRWLRGLFGASNAAPDSK